MPTAPPAPTESSLSVTLSAAPQEDARVEVAAGQQRACAGSQGSKGSACVCMGDKEVLMCTHVCVQGDLPFQACILHSPLLQQVVQQVFMERLPLCQAYTCLPLQLYSLLSIFLNTPLLSQTHCLSQPTPIHPSEPLAGGPSSDSQ